MKSSADEPPREADVRPTPPSKTRRKEAMHALQDLGEALVALDTRRLLSLNLPERLLDAIVQARSITKHEGRRRQMQYIGRLMRDVDPQPIRAALSEWSQGPEHERARFAVLERWRERMLNDADGLAAFAAAYPHADATRFAELVRDVQAERGSARPPHRYRALFREIRRIVDASDQDESNESDG